MKRRKTNILRLKIRPKHPRNFHKLSFAVGAITTCIIILTVVLFIKALSNIALGADEPQSNSSNITAQNSLGQSENQSPQYPDEVTDHIILHGPRDNKKIALTFDADMTNFMQQQIALHLYPESINRQHNANFERHKHQSHYFHYRYVGPDVSC